MELSLPDAVREALSAEGLSNDEALLMTGDELRQVIGDNLTYDLAVALAGQRRAFASYPGHSGRLPTDDLIERNLDILWLRIVERRSFKAIGAEVGLSRSRVQQILRWYHGVRVRRP